MCLSTIFVEIHYHRIITIFHTRIHRRTCLCVYLLLLPTSKRYQCDDDDYLINYVTRALILRSNASNNQTQSNHERRTAIKLDTLGTFTCSRYLFVLLLNLLIHLSKMSLQESLLPHVSKNVLRTHVDNRDCFWQLPRNTRMRRKYQT